MVLAEAKVRRAGQVRRTWLHKPTRRGSAGYGVAVGTGVGVGGTANSACSSVRA